MSLSPQEYANLADHCYGRNLDGSPVDLKALQGKIVQIEGINYKVVKTVDQPSGYQGTIYQKVGTGEFVVAHRGTGFGRELVKDVLATDAGLCC